MRRALLLAIPMCGLALAASGSAQSGAQALRTCVDRWNQGAMVSWGSMSVRIAVRGLDARERSVVSFPDASRSVCTVSLADRPGANAWLCRINSSGAYDCPLVTSDGMPPLRNANGRTDRHGVLTVSLPGTHPTPPLAWQRYPHADGFILPWTRSGKLRPGLRFVATTRGTCNAFVEHAVPASAVRCRDNFGYSDSCFPQRRPLRIGGVAACGSPGRTTFVRWVISGRL